MDNALTLRLARSDDIAGLERLIPLSVHGLQAPFYDAAQREAALGPVFGVDRQLIQDGTYFVVEHAGQLVGCGGWSRRRAVFGGDQSCSAAVFAAAIDGTDAPAASASASAADTAYVTEDSLDPARDPARVRAFFVHPDWARRGIGGALLAACESALRDAGFRAAVLVATLTGEPLYAAHGYAAVERYEVPLAGGLRLPVVRMEKRFSSAG